MLTLQNVVEACFTCECLMHCVLQEFPACAAPVRLYFEWKLQPPSPSLALQLSRLGAARELLNGGEKKRLCWALPVQSVSTPKMCKVQSGARVGARAWELPHTVVLCTSVQSLVINEQGEGSHEKAITLCLVPSSASNWRSWSWASVI